MTLLDIFNKLAKNKKGKGVKFDLLSNVVRGFKALPENGKRFKNKEEPEYAEVRFVTTYENALDALRGPNAKDSIGVILWFDAKEFLELYYELPKKSED
jgi:hypothetical protein